MKNSQASENESEWIRLPRPRKRCPVTGLSRTSLVELIDSRDLKSGEFLIQQYTKKRHGKQRGIRMINRASLLTFLERNAKEQCQRHFADHVNNPEKHSVEQVIQDYELWSFFVDVEFQVPMANWEKRSREERIECLENLGLLKPMGRNALLA